MNLTIVEVEDGFEYVVNVLSYEKVEGSLSADNDQDYYGYTEIDYEIVKVIFKTLEGEDMEVTLHGDLPSSHDIEILKKIEEFMDAEEKQ